VNPVPAFLITVLALGASVLLPADESGDLPEFLKRFDTNQDNQIDEEERQAIRDLRAGLQKKKRESIDNDDDGTISPSELRQARDTIRGSIQARRRQKFLTIAGEDERISPSEYATIPGIEALPARAFERIWDHLDLNRDGSISFEEFEGTLRNHRPPVTRATNRTTSRD
jgi:Ca2+-binding EF-hand superfamily protein